MEALVFFAAVFGGLAIISLHPRFAIRGQAPCKESDLAAAGVTWDDVRPQRSAPGAQFDAASDRQARPLAARAQALVSAVVHAASTPG